MSPTPSRPSRWGFTLIELLIVVAIIAILAAIAVPNFLQAQTRAKVSRALSDLRTMRIAAESYAVDTNHYPRESWGCGPFFDTLFGEPVWGTLTYAMTTPVQYMTNIPEDIFSKNVGQRRGERLYAYGSLESIYYFLDRIVGSDLYCPVPGLPGYIYVVGTRVTATKMSRYMGAYYLWSIGPAGVQMTPSGTVQEYFMQYDPTNGTVSNGRMFVTQKFSQPTYIPHDNFW